MKLIEYSRQDLNASSCIKTMHEAGIVKLAHDKRADIQSKDSRVYSKITRMNSFVPTECFEKHKDSSQSSWRLDDRKTHSITYKDFNL